MNIRDAPFPVLALDGNTYTATPNLLAFSGQTSALEREGRAVVVNTLNAHPVLGKLALLNSHRPVFPLAFGGEETDDWSICDWCDQCHRKSGLTVWIDAFEPAGGAIGGEALVAAILGKIAAVEVGPASEGAALAVGVPTVDADSRAAVRERKDSNRVALGGVRTYAAWRFRSVSLSPILAVPRRGHG